MENLKKFITTTIKEYLNGQQELETNLNNNFWRWFGSSKIIMNNKPLILYHASPNNSIKIFKPNWGTLGNGIYFSKQKSTWFGKNIYAVYLKIENPIYLTDNLEYSIGSYGLERDNAWDGVITDNEIMVRYPNQIKSVENDGTWDIGDNNIFS